MNWAMSQLHTAVVIQNTVPGIIAILKFRQKGNEKDALNIQEATIIINFKVIFHSKTQLGSNTPLYV